MPGRRYVTQPDIERQPMHRQLAAILRRQIDSGESAPGSRLPTEHELAARYGISRATVRHALGALAAEGAIDRQVGRGTFVTRPQTPPSAGGLLGVVFTRLKGLFLLSVLAGVQRAAAAQGYTLAVETSEHRRGAEEEAIGRLRARGALGVLLEPSPLCATPPAVLAALAATGFPLACVDRYLPTVPLPWVASDNLSGGQALASHLLRLGHRRLAFLLPREQATTAVRERVRGVEAALAAHGLNAADLVRLPLCGPATESVVPLLRQALDRLTELPLAERPTAILCGNDDLASELLVLLRERGLSVPGDLAVTGFDDLPFAEWVEPALTTIRQDAEGMGQAAVIALLAAMRTRGAARQGLRLPVELRIRGSTVATSHPLAPSAAQGQAGVG